MININVESCVDSDTFCQRLCIYYVVLLELAVMREVSVLMGFRFPNMFQDKGSTGTVITRIFFSYLIIIIVGCVLGYGLGGKQGNKYLANHMLERVRF